MRASAAPASVRRETLAPLPLRGPTGDIAFPTAHSCILRRAQVRYLFEIPFRPALVGLVSDTRCLDGNAETVNLDSPERHSVVLQELSGHHSDSAEPVIAGSSHRSLLHPRLDELAQMYWTVQEHLGIDATIGGRLNAHLGLFGGTGDA